MINNTLFDISVIIPFKDKAVMTLKALSSLIEYGPEVREIILVSNGSTPSEIDKINDAIVQYSSPMIKVLEYNHPFNYQKINNWAVKQTSGKFVLFLNNDTELIPESRGLLERMSKKASQPEVGITGCLLLYGDKKTIQHAGVFLMPRGMADHLYVGKKLSKALRDGGHTNEFPYSINEDKQMTAVTGAVNIIERKKFDDVKGFDESFIIGGGDVDLCIRLNKSGYQTWYVAGGHIIHKESQSRAHKPVTYNDFYYSYLSYIQAYDPEVGDPFLPKITREIR